jgi:glucokinase
MTDRSTTTGARLLADIGGTNARFAWQRQPGGEIEDLQTLACADHATLHDALTAYLRQCDRPCFGACAIAKPVVGDRVSMTNRHWGFSTRELKARWAHSLIRHLRSAALSCDLRATVVEQA